jgi:hypothetical protein
MGHIYGNWTIDMYRKQPTASGDKQVDENAAIPMPSDRKIKQMKGLIDDMLLVLAPTVFAETTIGEDEKVGAIHDAYDALEDALEALREV